MNLTENICASCKGEGGRLDPHAPPEDEFGNPPEWLPCEACDGSGLSRKVLDHLIDSHTDQEIRYNLGRRDGEIETRIEKILAWVEDQGTDGEAEGVILGGVLDNLEELKREFWPEESDVDP